MLKTWYSRIWKKGGQGGTVGRKGRIKLSSVVISSVFVCECIYQPENAKFNHTMKRHFVFELRMGKARMKLISVQF